MSRSLGLSLLCGSLALVAMPPRAVDAQGSPKSVSLSATVLPHATIEHHGSPEVRRLGNTTEYRVTLVVRANTSYRVVARRTDGTRGDVTLGVEDATARLASDRQAVQITRGAFGLTTFEITYEVESAGLETAAPVVTFDALPDAARQ